jgi:hypothetical protein
VLPGRFPVVPSDPDPGVLREEVLEVVELGGEDLLQAGDVDPVEGDGPRGHLFPGRPRVHPIGGFVIPDVESHDTEGERSVTSRAGERRAG